MGADGNGPLRHAGIHGKRRAMPGTLEAVLRPHRHRGEEEPPVAAKQASPQIPKAPGGGLKMPVGGRSRLVRRTFPLRTILIAKLVILACHRATLMTYEKSSGASDLTGLSLQSFT